MINTTSAKQRCEHIKKTCIAVPFTETYKATETRETEAYGEENYTVITYVNSISRYHGYLTVLKKIKGNRRALKK